jgi:hypothetical protein
VGEGVVERDTGGGVKRDTGGVSLSTPPYRQYRVKLLVKVPVAVKKLVTGGSKSGETTTGAAFIRFIDFFVDLRAEIPLGYP